MLKELPLCTLILDHSLQLEYLSLCGLFGCALVIGQKWDRSHMLENLSGYETDCAMIGAEDWQFTKARTIAAEYGIHVTEVYGYALNEGSTDEALDRILEEFKQVLNIFIHLTVLLQKTPCFVAVMLLGPYKKHQWQDIIFPAIARKHTCSTVSTSNIVSGRKS